MRVTPLQLVADRIDDVVEGESARLLGDPGLAYDLEQQVAELVTHVPGVALADGVLELVSLLDRVRGDARPGLLAIPGTAAIGITQPPHYFEQTPDRHESGPCQQVSERHEHPGSRTPDASALPRNVQLVND